MPLQTLFSNVRDVANDRLKTPIFGSFLVSWVIFNWKAIFIILFSNDLIESRIWYVSNYYGDILNLLIYPVVAAFSFTIGTPYLKEFLHQRLKPINQKLITEKNAFELNEYKHKRQVATEEIELELLKSKNLDAKELRGKIELLNSELDTEKNEKIELTKRLQEKNKELQQMTKSEGYFLSKIGKLERDLEYSSVVISELKNHFTIAIPLLQEKINFLLKHKKGKFEDIRNQYHTLYELKTIFNTFIGKKYDYEEGIRTLLTEINIDPKDLQNILEQYNRPNKDSQLSIPPTDLEMLFSHQLLFSVEDSGLDIIGLTDLGFALYIALRKHKNKSGVA